MPRTMQITCHTRWHCNCVISTKTAKNHILSTPLFAFKTKVAPHFLHSFFNEIHNKVQYCNVTQGRSVLLIQVFHSSIQLKCIYHTCSWWQRSISILSVEITAQEIATLCVRYIHLLYTHLQTANHIASFQPRDRTVSYGIVRLLLAGSYCTVECS